MEKQSIYFCKEFTMAKVRTPIGARIRRKRIAAGLSQVALARALGISASYLNLIENNKRDIGGKLLLRIGERLGIDLEHLSGESEARTIAAIGELMAEPVMTGIEIGPAAIRDLVARFPEAATVLARLHRAHADATVEIEVLRHRLKSDPLLSQLLHEILNRIAGIKSGAEILADIPDLTEAERARFIATKGSVALDGTSLTVNWVEGDRFSVLLIPHTLHADVTTWGARKVGDRVHLEVDQMARYVARLTEAA